jgi:hypothetical protein
VPLTAHWPVLGEGPGWLKASLLRKSWGFTWLIPLLCPPNRGQERSVATLGQSVQSPFS